MGMGAAASFTVTVVVYTHTHTHTHTHTVAKCALQVCSPHATIASVLSFRVCVCLCVYACVCVRVSSFPPWLVLPTQASCLA